MAATIRLVFVPYMRATGFVRDRSGLDIYFEVAACSSLPRAALGERARGILSIAAELLEPPIRCMTPARKNVAPD